MTRRTCPACGAPGVASDGRRGHECPACGTSFDHTDGAQRFAVVPSEHGTALRLTVEGEIDLVTAPLLQRHLDDAAAAGRSLVELDLSRVTFMDARGVNVLVVAQRSLQGVGGRLSLQAASEAVERTLRLCGIDVNLAAA